MANADNARGLTLARDMSSGYVSGGINRYYVPASDSTAIYLGQLVKPAGSADADGVMSVTGNVATGNPVLGVCVGIDSMDRDDAVYRTASTAAYIFVCTDPNAVFEVQDDSVGGALTAASVGNTADLTGFTSGNAVTGRSLCQIDSSTATATGDGTQDVVILGLVQRQDNEIGANAKWLVRLNNHFLVDGVAGA